MNKVKSVVISSVLALAIVGCATGPNSVVTNTCTYAQALIPGTIAAVMQYAVTQPAERAQIIAELHTASSAALALSTNGVISIADIENTFNISTDPVVNSIMAPIAALIENGIAQSASNNVTVAQTTQILQCVSLAINNATTPLAISNAVTKAQLKLSAVKHK